MSSILLFIAKKFLTPDKIANLIVTLIGRLISACSKTKKWDDGKAIADKVISYAQLFNEVYSDDTMTSEEEELIAQKIKDDFDLDAIAKLLKK